MTTSSHSILVLLILAAVLATSSATWKDHYPSPSHGGGNGDGQTPPDQYYPPPYCNGGSGGGQSTRPPYYYGKPPPNKHYHKIKPPPYDDNFPPCTPPYKNNPSPPQPPYYPPGTKTCPIDAWKLNECADALGDDDDKIHLLFGKKKKKVKAKCCPLFGEADDAAACLCTVIRELALGDKKMYVLAKLELLKTCGKDLLLYDGFQCLHPDSASTHKVDHPAPQLRV